MSWSICELAEITNLSTKIDYTNEALKLQSDINYLHMCQTNEIEKIDREYTDESALIETQFEEQTEGLSTTSAEYLNLAQAKLQRQKELDNEHTRKLNKINRDTDAKVKPLELRKERIEAQEKNADAQRDAWEEARNKSIENECAYFKN